MKQVIFSTFTFLYSFIFFSCANKKTDNAVSEQVSANTTTTKKFDYTKEGTGNILIDSVTTYRYKTNFEDKIRRFPFGVINDKVSKSVWFSREAILLLADYLKDETNGLDGARIHLISYDSLNTAPGQYKPHQVSIVMVPTNPLATDKSKHIDNWKILVPEKYIADSTLKKMGFIYGLNHGELCPTKCN